MESKSKKPAKSSFFYLFTTSKGEKKEDTIPGSNWKIANQRFHEKNKDVKEILRAYKN